jgi:tripartite-type tricarboxylate transporter receptor subunit TctC
MVIHGENQMKIRFLASTLALATAVVFATLAAPAHSAFPDKPVTLVVPFPPGGSTDVVARALALEAAKELGQPVIIENRAGAGTVIGSAYVAKAAADGYTVLMGQTALAVNASLRKQLPYDTAKDFVPIALVADHPGILLTAASKPYNTLPEFLAYVRARPGQVSYASPGVGSWPHLLMELLASEAKLQLIHAPYQGNGPLQTDLVGGRVDAAFGAYATARGLVKDGRLKILAVTGTQRELEIPNVGTTSEAGYPNSASNYWMGILAPAGTPPEVVARLENAFVAAAKSEAFASTLTAQSIHPNGRPARDLATLIKKELAMWAALIKTKAIEQQP